MVQHDVIVIGAGAAGLMCASSAGQRGRSVLVLDHGKRPGRKILIAGGGRCNFTNYDVTAKNYLSQNPHFVKSALAQYTNWDFISMIYKHGIEFEERDHGQLFCVNEHDSKDIVKMLIDECDETGNVSYKYQCEVTKIERIVDNYFVVETTNGIFKCKSLVVATGGLSMPRLGATPFGWKVAEQFGLGVIAPQPALVPFTLDGREKGLTELTGTALPVRISCNNHEFLEALLFTHRGISGPSVLQISSYWNQGDIVKVDWLPSLNILDLLEQAVINNPAQEIKTTLSKVLPRRLVEYFIELSVFENKPLRQLSRRDMESISAALHSWEIKPNGTEGYRTAEATTGGVDTDYLSSKTMEAKNVSGLYFVGECVDVTGHLGGFNFQWAWSSGWVAGQNV
ncbi:TPA: NAD(P)/FAD-dependent oxidoreductase [Vibrio parahaemolyticus]|uniref:NAD(P)/FAD-dependent oxidoreductase n=1 Tax=Vibrio TaxID=662 RepID=UPI0014286AEE|nr:MULTISPECIES: NAD(P)/FAD-dependent oxidoreductase [Vibrio]EJG0888032.1 NAD(P)/FAD-dependent oxidoreductase [Vibrio parahaemolyticus]EJG1636892.1 NAD(P)/FAD-dependent oxidoreductase [Vibrio alginolyticus]MCR9515356.1 NAD(P)/FAD-dependent oxidoreductase [Vibrio alginolyticus]MDY8151211.1 NAD(P)/FAD-dependent oxidoreductase [Vibrio sp. PBL-C16]QIR94249.1 NAD(P)/FAD-dependent oxidoreductase [Vibrio alginolyticus]